MNKRGKPPRNISGMRFGRWLIVGTEPCGSVPTKWMARCDCGTIRPVVAAQVVSGHSYSCGCFRRERASSANTRDPELVARKHLYRCTRNSAKDRGYSFSLTYDEWSKIISSNCYLCGSPPEEKDVTAGAYRDKGVKYIKRVMVNGIDRKDNALGYELTNCHPCCTTCNRMKHAKSEKDFLSQVAKIAKFRGV